MFKAAISSLIFTIGSPAVVVSADNASSTKAERSTRRVLVVVWDGMRPDFMTEQNCPTLYQLSKRGVFFAHHHSVYLSGTEVNGTAISTGLYPGNDGIIANSEYRPAIDPLKPIHTEGVASVRRADELSGGRYIRVPTLAEAVRKAGRRAVVAGAKPVALLPDRAERTSMKHGANVFAGSTLPPELRSVLTNKLGPFPTETDTNRTRNDWTTDALLNSLWAEGIPDFTFLWMNQPDYSQHYIGPGSAEALASIRNADQNLSRIVKNLEDRGALETTDIIVVSDHGCSTLDTKVDLAGSLSRAGLPATREFKASPMPGEIIVVSNSGSTLVYVIGHSDALVQKIVSFLQEWEFTGVIFTRKAMPGTFSLDQVHLNSPDSPDVVISMRWSATTNKNGVVGLVNSDATSFNSGQGIHVSLSPFDMHATLVAAGPDFRSGIVSTLPTGNVDVAPTVLRILGITPAARLDGRVLSEGLTVNGPALKSFEPRRIEASVRVGNKIWKQYLNFTEVNGVAYLDEGNGAQLPANN
jgi:arylsulfatase A-like enzyme